MSYCWQNQVRVYERWTTSCSNDASAFIIDIIIGALSSSTASTPRVYVCVCVFAIDCLCLGSCTVYRPLVSSFYPLMLDKESRTTNDGLRYHINFAATWWSNRKNADVGDFNEINHPFRQRAPRVKRSSAATQCVCLHIEYSFSSECIAYNILYCMLRARCWWRWWRSTQRMRSQPSAICTSTWHCLLSFSVDKSHSRCLRDSSASRVPPRHVFRTCDFFPFRPLAFSRSFVRRRFFVCVSSVSCESHSGFRLSVREFLTWLIW